MVYTLKHKPRALTAKRGDQQQNKKEGKNQSKGECENEAEDTPAASAERVPALTYRSLNILSDLGLTPVLS